MPDKVTQEEVYSALRKCMDPEIPVNVVDLGLIYGVKVNEENNIDIEMTMTTRGCPLHDTLVSDVKRYVGKINGVAGVNVSIVWDPPWSVDKIEPYCSRPIGVWKAKAQVSNRLRKISTAGQREVNYARRWFIDTYERQRTWPYG